MNSQTQPPVTVTKKNSTGNKVEGSVKNRPTRGIIGQQYTDGVHLYVCTASGTPGTWTKVT